MKLLIAILFLLFAIPAVAQPSFRCSGQLNATERAICDSPTVSALDRRMAALFRERFASLNAPRQRRLRTEQLTWLDWRNTCGRSERCLQTRYQQRIADFMPGLVPVPIGTPPPGPDDVVERRVRNGRMETVYGDGRIVWQSISGGSFGTDYPNGTVDMATAIQIPGAPVPPLPANMSEWGGTVENDLLTIIDQLLPPPDRLPYRDLFSHEPYPERMLSHLSVIQHLTGE